MLKKKNYISDNQMGDNDFPYNYTESDSSSNTPKNTPFYTDNLDIDTNNFDKLVLEDNASNISFTDNYSSVSTPKTPDMSISSDTTTPKAVINSDNKFKKEVHSFKDLIDYSNISAKSINSYDSYSNLNSNEILGENMSDSNISGLEENKEYVMQITNEDNNKEQSNTSKRNPFFITSTFNREVLSEFIGMYVYILMGNGIYSQVVIYGLNNEVSFINWFYISIGWGLSLIFGTYVALIGNDNGYLNPAIALSMYMLNKISLDKLLYYTGIYYIASFLAASTVYLLNIINIQRITYNIETANIFSTYKDDSISLTTGFFMECVIMSLFTYIFLCINKNITTNAKKNNEMYSKMIGLLFIGISLGFGFSTQMAINPARDLGPRIFTAMAPWYENVFTYSDYWFWVPIIAPYIGTMIGCGLFYIIVESQ